MDMAVADVARWRFSTDALPERERGAALDAVYGRNTVVAYEALPDSAAMVSIVSAEAVNRMS
jgi:hypothetical protein